MLFPQKLISDTETERLRRVYQTYQQQGYWKKRWSTDNPGNREILAERDRLIAGQIIHLFKRLGHKVNFLEMGCGSGVLLENMLRLTGREIFAQVIGVDLDIQRLLEAGQRLAGIQLICCDAAVPPLRAADFHVVLLATVFSSVLDEQKQRALATAAQTLIRANGIILVYDFRYPSPRNPYVRPVLRKQLQTWFPGMVMNYRSLTLLPPLARRLGKQASRWYPLLVRLPVLRSHFLAVFSNHEKLTFE